MGRRSREKLVADEMNVATVRHVHREGHAAIAEPRSIMDTIELEPMYSGREISGKCLKCLAEHKLFSCLRDLLTSKTENPVSQEQYETILAFLQSLEFEKLRAESEKYLSDGKRVVLKIDINNGQPRYELQVK